MEQMIRRLRVLSLATAINVVACLAPASAAPAAADATLTAVTVVTDASTIAFPGSDTCEKHRTSAGSVTCSASVTGHLDESSGSGSGHIAATLGEDALGFLTSIATSGDGRASATAGAGGSNASDVTLLIVTFDVVRSVMVEVQGSLAASGDGACSRVLIASPTTDLLDVRAPGSDCGAGGTTLGAPHDQRRARRRQASWRGG